METEQHKKRSVITFTVTREEKAKFIQAAYPHKLVDWILKALHSQAEKDAK